QKSSPLSSYSLWRLGFPPRRRQGLTTGLVPHPGRRAAERLHPHPPTSPIRPKKLSTPPPGALLLPLPLQIRGEDHRLATTVGRLHPPIHRTSFSTHPSCPTAS
uniref:Uncharacterized protein n=1 Tax=Aegilops tauschii subsp. strangulata TaxID=200361 RepID=A0A453N6H6_AEGTS